MNDTPKLNVVLVVDEYVDKNGKPAKFERLVVQMKLGSATVNVEIEGKDRTGGGLIRDFLKGKL